MICSIENCNNKVHARNLCKHHWAKLRYSEKKSLGLTKEYYQKVKHKKLIDNALYAKTPKGKYIYARAIAKRRNIEFNLTREEFVQLIKNNQCTYCSGPLSPRGCSLDRLDNLKGYLIDNVVPCCGDCNYLRGDLLTPEETKAVVNLLKKLRNKENIWY